jgi:hypothetical protein
MKRQIVFVAGKYRSKYGIIGRAWNIWKAYQAGRCLVEQGYSVYIPHCNTMFMDGLRPDEWFIQSTLKMLPKCHVIYMLKGWRDSVGACAEFQEAVIRGLDVWYEDESDYPVWTEVKNEEYVPLEAINAEQMAT